MILFQCIGCRRELRALGQHQGRRSKCPCGMEAWIPGEGVGFWLSLVQPLFDNLNWNCPHCQGKVPPTATTCSHCNKELPALVKPE
jgi:hypothetical protein